jgi:adenine deaminase
VEHEPCLGLTRCELVWVRHGTIEKVFNKLVELFTAKELRAKYFCEKNSHLEHLWTRGSSLGLRENEIVQDEHMLQTISMS